MSQDVLICGFPRSGNHLLKEIILKYQDINCVKFVHTTPYELVNFKLYIDSHINIYLYRNPYDTLYSTYIHMRISNRIDKNFTFAEFILGNLGDIYKFTRDDTEHGIFYNPVACWDTHVYWGNQFMKNIVYYDNINNSPLMDNILYNMLNKNTSQIRKFNYDYQSEIYASADGIIKPKFYSLKYYTNEMMEYIRQHIYYNTIELL